jgi:hypothetical protein
LKNALVDDENISPTYPLIKATVDLVLLSLWCLTPNSTNISVISWWSVLLVDEFAVPRENQ